VLLEGMSISIRPLWAGHDEHCGAPFSGLRATMNIFIDTEFSGLGSDPRLISIALVAEQGAELYIELTSGWSAELCSRWVVEHVLPQLGDGEKRLF
jgi:hypothetical protein